MLITTEGFETYVESVNGRLSDYEIVPLSLWYHTCDETAQRKMRVDFTALAKNNGCEAVTTVKKVSWPNRHWGLAGLVATATGVRRRHPGQTDSTTASMLSAEKPSTILELRGEPLCNYELIPLMFCAERNGWTGRNPFTDIEKAFLPEAKRFGCALIASLRVRAYDYAESPRYLAFATGLRRRDSADSAQRSGALVTVESPSTVLATAGKPLSAYEIVPVTIGVGMPRSWLPYRSFELLANGEHGSPLPGKDLQTDNDLDGPTVAVNAAMHIAARDRISFFTSMSHLVPDKHDDCNILFLSLTGLREKRA